MEQKSNHTTTIKRLFPNASKSTLEANSIGPEKGPDPKHNLCHGTLAEAARKAGYSGRSLVSVTSYRAILADFDNLTAKWFVDALRYAGVLYDDRPEDIVYQIRQKKVEKKTQEKTLIEITYT